MSIFSTIDEENGIELARPEILEEDPKPLTETKIVDDKVEDGQDVKLIEKRTKKKCIYINSEGKKCRRKAEEGDVYCSECLEKQDVRQVIEEEETPKFVPLTIDTCTKTMLALHISAYMLIESMSQLTDYRMCGLVDELKNDSEELKEIYQNIIEFYGQEAVAQILNPMASLTLLSLKHGISALDKGKKKE